MLCLSIPKSRENTPENNDRHVTLNKEVSRMLVHAFTTTSECKMHQYLTELRHDERKAFVLTTRIPDDEIHVRYDVFEFVKEES